MSQFMLRYCYYYLYIVNILIMLGINSEEIKQQQMRGTDVPHRMVWDNITLSFIKDIVTLPEDAPTLKSTYWNLTNPLGETYKVGKIIIVSIKYYQYNNIDHTLRLHRSIHKNITRSLRFNIK